MAGKGEFEVDAKATFRRVAPRSTRWSSTSTAGASGRPGRTSTPTCSRTYSGPDAGPARSTSGQGTGRPGPGRMEITDAVEPSKIQIALQFLKPFKANNRTTFEFVERDGQTDVTWRWSEPRRS